MTSDFCMLGNLNGFVTIAQSLSKDGTQGYSPVRALSFDMNIELKNRGNAAIRGSTASDEVFLALTGRNLLLAGYEETVVVKFSDFSLASYTY